MAWRSAIRRLGAAGALACFTAAWASHEAVASILLDRSVFAYAETLLATPVPFDLAADERGGDCGVPEPELPRDHAIDLEQLLAFLKLRAAAPNSGTTSTSGGPSAGSTSAGSFFVSAAPPEIHGAQCVLRVAEERAPFIPDPPGRDLLKPPRMRSSWPDG